MNVSYKIYHNGAYILYLQALWKFHGNICIFDIWNRTRLWHMKKAAVGTLNEKRPCQRAQNGCKYCRDDVGAKRVICLVFHKQDTSRICQTNYRVNK
jgi:hypothetical protein